MAIFGIDRILAQDFTELANDLIGLYWYAPENGVVTTLTFYGNANAIPGSGGFQGAIYTRTGVDSGDFLEQTNTTTLNTTPGWTTLTFNNPVPVTAGTIYWLCWWSDQDYDIKYDTTGNTSQTMVFTGNTYPNPPVTFSLAAVFDVVDSVYVTFTPTAEAGKPRILGVSSTLGLSSLVI